MCYLRLMGGSLFLSALLGCYPTDQSATDVAAAVDTAPTTARIGPPVRNNDTEIVTDFLTAEDGTLDSFDDLLLDADPCDPERPFDRERQPARSRGDSPRAPSSKPN